jgi:hypothetical protein
MKKQVTSPIYRTRSFITGPWQTRACHVHVSKDSQTFIGDRFIGVPLLFPLFRSEEETSKGETQ